MGPGTLVTAILFSQAVGIPATLLFGKVATRIGPKRALMMTLAVYACVSFLGYFMRTPVHFFVLASVVGLVQGGSQALSRSLFTRLVPRHKATQFFGFFSVFEKFSALFGPAVVAAMVGLTGSSRAAILSMLLFFVAGAAVLSRVDVEAGIRAARDAEARAAAHA
jgi:UMF1 family MFS transporter